MNKYFYIALIIPFVLACSKDVVEPTPEPVPEQPHVAGQSEAGDYHEEFTTPMSIAISWDAQVLYGEGHDSLDLNMDGAYDLFFELHVLNPDSIHLLSGMPNPFPNLTVNSGNNSSISAVVEFESVPIGMGQTTTYTFVKALAQGEEYTSQSDWGGLYQFGRVMWGETPGTVGTPSNGPWYNLADPHYIGIRFDDKYGWVKIDTSDPKNPLILGYNLEA